MCLREIDREWLCIYINKGVCVFVCASNERTREDSFHALFALADNAECAFFMRIYAYTYMRIRLYAGNMRLLPAYGTVS